jgi:hypothetical protein
MPVDYYRFVPEYKTAHFKQVIAFGSTANSIFSTNAKILDILTFEYFDSFFIYHRLYVCLDIFSKQQCKEASLVGLKEVHARTLATKIKTRTFPPKFIEKESIAGSALAALKFTIVRRIGAPQEELLAQLTSLPPDNVVCFLNFEEPEVFYNGSREDLLPHFAAIKINETPTKDICFNPLEEEYIWLFCKNAAVLESLKSYSHHKILPNVGITLDARACTESEKIDLLAPKKLACLETRLSQSQA